MMTRFPVGAHFARLFGVFLALSTGMAQAAITPYLQSPTQSSIWVSWKTATGTQSTVEYGLAEDALSELATGANQSLASDYQYHSVQLTGLQPDTYYYYRAKTGTEVSEIHRFKTPPVAGKSDGHIRVLVMGDHQIRAEDRYRKLVAAAKSKLESLYGKPVEESVNLILNDGDQVDVGTLDHYEHLHFGQSAALSPNLPIMTTVGNHEYYQDGKLANYQAHFIYDGLSYQGIPGAADESYYAYQIGRVLFVHLNSMRTDAAQQQWLVQVMAAADADASVDWVISVIHHPYQAEQYVGDISHTLRNAWMAILTASRKHVLNIGGHHHLYARGQTREWPSYHMISGGTAWDQYWGQATEVDFDDVQKTISNWAWQIIDIDVAAREMTVHTYAEAHPIIYRNNGRQMHYNSRLIDSFHRRLDGGAPNRPNIVTSVNGPLDGSQTNTFVSSPFSTAEAELLNSTQFQIATDAGFNNLEVDRIRDYENIYGDTGAPDYEPVDIHQGLNILEWEVPAFGLKNGDYFIRVRHRDRNAEWSDWSDAVAFSVENSIDGDPELNLDKERYDSGDDVIVGYANGHGNPQDWIGIYRKGDTPGNQPATQWSYVSGTSGSLNFSGLADGEYFVAFFSDGGHDEIAPRRHFYLGPVVELSIDRTPDQDGGIPAYDEGETITFTWSGAPGGARDWIGIYRVGHTPGQDYSTEWAYTPDPAGTLSLDSPGEGFWFAAFFINDAYTEVSQRLLFSVGEAPARVTLPKIDYDLGEDITVYFSGGPGIPKDYIGIFEQGAIPGLTGSELVAYAYFDGLPSGEVTFTETIPEGEYFLAMYTNDSYDQVSNRACFVVGEATGCASLDVSKSSYEAGEPVTLSWARTPGGTKDWIGIYRAGENPGDQSSVQWSYIQGSSGSLDFTGLSEGDYFAVVLLDDGYQEATDRAAFSIEAPTAATLTASKAAYAAGEAVRLSWANTPGGAKDWIGIYRAGDTPGAVSSSDWSYIAGSSGSLDFTGLPEGEYFAALFLNDGFGEATERVSFSVTPPPTLSASKTTFSIGETVSLSWANTPGGATDWLGIYRQGQTPGEVGSTQWTYLGSGNQSGSHSFTGLPEGEWYGVVMIDDGYEEITERVEFRIEPQAVAGDLDGDGIVNAADRNRLRGAFGQCTGDPGFIAEADYNVDGCINFHDYRLWLAIYRQQ